MWRDTESKRLRAAAYAIFFGAILIVGTIWEHWQYRKPAKYAPDGWQETNESFVDPLTGKRLRQRKYVEIETTRGTKL
jgi:hypothetical protein